MRTDRYLYGRVETSSSWVRTGTLSSDLRFAVSD